MNGPDDDDSISTWTEDQLVSLSVLAESERIEHAESILDAPEDAGPEDLPTMQSAWEWLWNNDRREYHRAMSNAILLCPDHLINELLEIPC